MSNYTPFVPKARPMTPERERRIERLRGIYDIFLGGLSEVRLAQGLSQVQLAESLHVSQANISRLERADDMYLSTLERYIEGLGGRLALQAIFPDQTIELPLTSQSWRAQEAPAHHDWAMLGPAQGATTLQIRGPDLPASFGQAGRAGYRQEAAALVGENPRVAEQIEGLTRPSPQLAAA